MPRAIAARPYPGVTAIDLDEDITVDLLLVVGAHVDAPLREAVLALGDRLIGPARAAPPAVAPPPGRPRAATARRQARRA